MTRIPYNQERYIELLKHEQDLKNQKKFLMDEYREEFNELVQYDGAVRDHMFWQKRESIRSILEDFLNEKMDVTEFRGCVSNLRYQSSVLSEEFKLKLLSNSEELKNFQPNENLERLHEFLRDLFLECEKYYDEDENEKFYISIQNIFGEFQNALHEE